MGFLDRFRRKGKGDDQAPEPTPGTPPAPAQAPAEPKPRGRFGRLFRRKPKEQAPAPTPAPTPPPAPPVPVPGGGGEAPPEEPEAPAGGEGSEGGEGGEGGEGEGEGEGEERDYSDAPSSLFVTIHGRWATSGGVWTGTVSGTLHGQTVIRFLKAMDDGDRQEEAVMMVIYEYDQGSGFADAVDLSRSSWDPPEYGY
jgi:hypothetical protein